MEFRERLIERYGFKDSDREETVSRFKPLSFTAKSLFVESGKIANMLGYLRKGMMRSFFYDDQVASRENIITIEDCELDVITYKRMLELIELVPAWRQIAKNVDEFKYNELMNRSIQLQTLTASERYQLFISKHPEILQRVALRHIASYLGIDIATLSSIRKSV